MGQSNPKAQQLNPELKAIDLLALMLEGEWGGNIGTIMGRVYGYHIGYRLGIIWGSTPPRSLKHPYAERCSRLGKAAFSRSCGATLGIAGPGMHIEDIV